MELKIHYAQAKDLKYIDYLQKKNAEDLSFYPIGVLEREVQAKRILLALVNNTHAGYLYHGSLRHGHVVKIHQACIQYDLRGNWYGAGLFNQLEKNCLNLLCKSISLRCGSDIAANKFWSLMGFNCVDVQKGGVRRMRDINIWYKELYKDLLSSQEQFVTPSTKKKDASIWQKRDKTLKQSSMKRGKSLIDYRKTVIKNSKSCK